MFDRFTDSARSVMALAQKEAQKLNHEYIETEHILLGILQMEHPCMARRVLERLHVDPTRIREEVLLFVQQGPPIVNLGKLPFTPRAKDALESAFVIAGEHGHNYIGTEHLLVSVAISDGLAREVMHNLDVSDDAVLQAFNAELQELETIEVPDDAGKVSPEELVRILDQTIAFARELVKRLESIERKIDKVFSLPKPKGMPSPTSGNPNAAPISPQPPPNSGSSPVTSPSENTTIVPCHACGDPMVRSGSCYKCLNCGETSGCS